MLFHFAKTRKRQAKTIAINILMIPLILFVFQKVGGDQPNFDAIFEVVLIIAVLVSLTLTGLLIWFLKRKDKFEIYVKENEFYSHHPSFAEWCFSISPKDIVKIEHRIHIGVDRMTNINVHLLNGNVVQICQNHPFSRKDLYSALKKANPEIELPDNANGFKHEPSKETDEFAVNSFPITTKIIKLFLRIASRK